MTENQRQMLVAFLLGAMVVIAVSSASRLMGWPL